MDEFVPFELRLSRQTAEEHCHDVRDRLSFLAGIAAGLAMRGECWSCIRQLLDEVGEALFIPSAPARAVTRLEVLTQLLTIGGFRREDLRRDN
jgi:hypothetical protein